MILVVGLGNPGPRYEATRHNIGFVVLDTWAKDATGAAFREKFHGEFASFDYAGQKIGLLKPQTYMNESGRSVQAATSFHKPDQLLVVHDELDVPFGQLRLKQAGGDAGHRGLRSITEHLGSGDYGRLRFGIGRPPPDFKGKPADFVLNAFSSIERAELGPLVARAIDAVKTVVTDGFASAMNRTNQRAQG